MYTSKQGGSFRRAGLLGVLLFISFALAGCGGTQQVADQDPGVVAFEFLPNVGSTDHHPDALEDLSLSDNRSGIVFKESFAAVLAKWTVRPRYLDAPSRSHRPFLSFRGGESARTTQFADGHPGASPFVTLGSKEVALARLAASHDLTALPRDEARERISKQLTRYGDTLRVDVYFRRRPLSALRNMEVSLQDDQSRRYPLVARSYRLGAASNRGRRIDYQRMSLFFGRAVDGQDLLDAAEALRLRVVSSGERWTFEWGWDRASAGPSSRAADR